LLSPEEYKKAQSKKTKIPLWIFLSIVAFIFLKFILQSSNSLDQKSKFFNGLKNAETVKYEKFGKLNDLRGLPSVSSGILTKNQVECILSSKNAWITTPNEDTKQFYLKLLFNNENLVLDMRLYKNKVYFSGIVVKENSYDGLGFSEGSKCTSTSSFNEI